MKSFLHFLSAPGPSPLVLLVLTCVYLLLQDADLSVTNQVILGLFTGITTKYAEITIHNWSSKK
jgi:hypothetical protein